MCYIVSTLLSDKGLIVSTIFTEIVLYIYLRMNKKKYCVPEKQPYLTFKLLTWYEQAAALLHYCYCVHNYLFKLAFKVLCHMHVNSTVESAFIFVFFCFIFMNHISLLYLFFSLNFIKNTCKFCKLVLFIFINNI